MLTAFADTGRRARTRAKEGSTGAAGCPIWVDGFLNGVEMRKTLETRDWEKAQETIRDWEAEGAPVPEAKPRLNRKTPASSSRSTPRLGTARADPEEVTGRSSAATGSPAQRSTVPEAMGLGHRPRLSRGVARQRNLCFEETGTTAGLVPVRPRERLIGENPASKLKTPR